MVVIYLFNFRGCCFFVAKCGNFFLFIAAILTKCLLLLGELGQMACCETTGFLFLFSIVLVPVFKQLPTGQQMMCGAELGKGMERGKQ